MNSNDKDQGPNFKLMSNEKCKKIRHPLMQTQPELVKIHNGKKVNN